MNTYDLRYDSQNSYIKLRFHNKVIFRPLIKMIVKIWDNLKTYTTNI